MLLEEYLIEKYGIYFSNNMTEINPYLEISGELYSLLENHFFGQLSDIISGLEVEDISVFTKTIIEYLRLCKDFGGIDNISFDTYLGTQQLKIEMQRYRRPLKLVVGSQLDKLSDRELNSIERITKCLIDLPKETKRKI